MSRIAEQRHRTFSPATNRLAIEERPAPPFGSRSDQGARVRAPIRHGLADEPWVAFTRPALLAMAFLDHRNEIDDVAAFQRVMNEMCARPEPEPNLAHPC